MKMPLALCVVVASSFVSRTAFSDVLEQPSDILEAVQSGRKGAWLDTTALKKCLQADIEKENGKKQLENCDMQFDIVWKELLDTSNLLRIAEDTTKSCEEVSKIHEFSVSRCEESLAAWYHDPIVMFAIGSFVGAISAAIMVTQIIY